MNWLERAISVVSPAMAAQRVAARLRLEYIDQMAEKFSYDAVRQKRRMGNWIAPGTDANSATATGLVPLRNMGRDLVRNNPHARQAINQLVGAQIGTGAVLRAATDRQSVNQVIDSAWSRWCDECDSSGMQDFNGLQWQVAKAVPESGEALVRFRSRRKSDGLSVPLQIQLLESDFLDHSKTQAFGSGQIIQGVEFDAIGKRSGYWLFRSHPGSTIQFSRGGNYDSAFIPADDIAHVYLIERPGQVRGVTWLASVMADFRQLATYDEAIWARRNLEACIGLIVNRADASVPDGYVGTLATDAESGKVTETLEPGMIVHAKPGQTITGFDPKVSDDSSFRNGKLQAIGAGLSLPFEMLTGNFENINYSSYRAGQLSFRHVVDQYRWMTFYKMFLERVWRRWIETAYLAGVIPVLDYRMKATFPKFESVEPKKDIEATISRVRATFQPHADAVAEYGFDPEEVISQAVDWNKRMDDAEIISDADPRKDVARIAKAADAAKGGA